MGAWAATAGMRIKFARVCRVNSAAASAVAGATGAAASCAQHGACNSEAKGRGALFSIPRRQRQTRRELIDATNELNRSRSEKSIQPFQRRSKLRAGVCMQTSVQNSWISRKSPKKSRSLRRRPGRGLTRTTVCRATLGRTRRALIQLIHRAGTIRRLTRRLESKCKETTSPPPRLSWISSNADCCRTSWSSGGEFGARLQSGDINPTISARPHPLCFTMWMRRGAKSATSRDRRLWLNTVRDPVHVQISRER